MPYPNEHACRLSSPDKYDRFARKNCGQKHNGKCINVIYGIKNNKSEIQALRYNKKIWTADAARSHCKSRGGSFEAARNDSIEFSKIKTLRFPICPIKFKEETDYIIKGDKIYRNAILLTDGIWTDSLTKTPVEYKKSMIDKYGRNWTRNFLNIDHDWSVRSRIGRVFNQKARDGKVYGDLYIYPGTRVAKDTINLIEHDLINWCSVEILTNDSWDKDRQMYVVENMEFIGCAIVSEPACIFSKVKSDGPDYIPPYEINNES